MLHMMHYSLLRMIRGYTAIALLFALPLVIITLLIIAVGDFFQTEELSSKQYIAIMMVVTFQIFSGNYAMGYIHDDVVTSRKWRLRSLPVSITKYSTSILLASTLFSTVQAMLLVAYTRFVFGVDWGQYGWVIVFMLVISLLSQFVHLTMAFAAKQFSMAERFTEIYGVGFILLAGIIFPMPNWGVIEWINSYLNPITIGQTALTSLVAPSMDANLYFNLMLLLLQTLLFMFATMLLGRRKLA